MMPGARASPSAFTVSLAAPSLPPPSCLLIASILPFLTPRSPRTGALPAPSKISASFMTRSNIRFPPLPPCWSRRAGFSSAVAAKLGHDRCNRRSPAAPPGRGLVCRARGRGDRAGRLARPRHGRGHVRLRYRPLLSRPPADRRRRLGQGGGSAGRSRRGSIGDSDRRLGGVGQPGRVGGGGGGPCRPALSRALPRLAGD